MSIDTGDWRAATWLLERLEPQVYGPRLRVQLEATLGEEGLTALSDEDLDALTRGHARRPRLLGRDAG